MAFALARGFFSASSVSLQVTRMAVVRLSGNLGCLWAEILIRVNAAAGTRHGIKVHSTHPGDGGKKLIQIKLTDLCRLVLARDGG
jgi:hypothetical protein